MTAGAFLTQANTVRRILDHLGLPSVPPIIDPAASSYDAGTDPQLDIDDLIGDHLSHDISRARSRAPLSRTPRSGGRGP